MPRAPATPTPGRDRLLTPVPTRTPDRPGPARPPTTPTTTPTPTSGRPQLSRRVQLAELDAGVGGREAPVDADLAVVAVLLPGPHLALHLLDGLDPAAQALPL